MAISSAPTEKLLDERSHWEHCISSRRLACSSSTLQLSILLSSMLLCSPSLSSMLSCEVFSVTSPPWESSSCCRKSARSSSLRLMSSQAARPDFQAPSSWSKRPL